MRSKANLDQLKGKLWEQLVLREAWKVLGQEELKETKRLLDVEYTRVLEWQEELEVEMLLEEEYSRMYLRIKVFLQMLMKVVIWALRLENQITTMGTKQVWRCSSTC